jgi:hypothetical protein
MIIDRKFKFVATNPCKGNVYTEANAVLFAAKDKALPHTIREYIKKCKLLRCGKEHIESMELLLERIILFQETDECRIPDTDTDCEIDRCIGGNLK